MSNASIGIIGGADGLTAIFIAGNIGAAVLSATAIAVALMLVLYFALYRRADQYAKHASDGPTAVFAKKRYSVRRIVSLTVSALAAVVLDQWVKLLTVASFAAPAAQQTMTASEPQRLIPGIMQLTRVHNYGAAWSSLSGSRWLLVVLTGGGMVLLSWLLVRIVRHPLGQWSLSLVIGGGVGNLIDRVRFGYVVDMLDVTFISYPVFNIADCFVVVGTVAAVVYYLKYYPLADQKNWEKYDGDHAS